MNAPVAGPRQIEEEFVIIPNLNWFLEISCLTWRNSFFLYQPWRGYRWHERHNIFNKREENGEKWKGKKGKNNDSTFAGVWSLWNLSTFRKHTWLLIIQRKCMHAVHTVWLASSRFSRLAGNHLDSCCYSYIHPVTYWFLWLIWAPERDILFNYLQCQNKKQFACKLITNTTKRGARSRNS